MTFKTSTNVTLPDTKDIPRASPSNNPRDGLGPKKNIIEGVADEDYVWSTSTGESDSDEEPLPEPRDRMEDTSMEENLVLVVSEEGNMQ